MFDLSLSVGELMVRAAAVYFALFVLLRFIGKKHVGELSPFDLVVLLIISETVDGSLIGSDGSLIGDARPLGASGRLSRLAKQDRGADPRGHAADPCAPWSGQQRDIGQGADHALRVDRSASPRRTHLHHQGPLCGARK